MEGGGVGLALRGKGADGGAEDLLPRGAAQEADEEGVAIDPPLGPDDALRIEGGLQVEVDAEEGVGGSPGGLRGGGRRGQLPHSNWFLWREGNPNSSLHHGGELLTADGRKHHLHHLCFHSPDAAWIHSPA